MEEVAVCSMNFDYIKLGGKSALYREKEKNLTDLALLLFRGNGEKTVRYRAAVSCLQVKW